MSYQGAGSRGAGTSAVASIQSGRRAVIRYDARSFNTQNSFGDPREWRLWEARRSRYAIQWSHYEGTLYDAINAWLEELKEDKALYEFVRHIYSPANRLGEFWATHIYGGALDPDAGDGFPVRSGIPIVTQSTELRGAIAKLWKDSNWQVQKEIVGRFGSVMGDVAMTVVDDPRRKMVKLSVVDPRHIFDVDEDPFGNCRGYVLRKMVPDPEWDVVEDGRGDDGGTLPCPYVEYLEICRRRGDAVVYETYKDGEAYDWSDPDGSGVERRGEGWQWIEEYGFVPFVRIQHKDIGLGFGMSEFSPALLSKLYELDDQASKFGDYVRRAVDSPWLMSGINADDMTSEENDTRKQTGDRKGEGKQRVPIIWASEPNARAQPLIAPLDLPAVMENIRSILRVIEQEHPELTADLALATGDASGRALRVAKEKAEALVIQRRATYDDALRRLQQMAISIAAMNRYPGYETFTADSYARGDLDHQIGQRPVFALSNWEMLEEELERSKVVLTLTQAGVPLETAWTRAGYKEEDVALMMEAREREVEFSLKQIQVRQAQAMSDGASYGLNQ
jgi:hypothetical protein